MILLSITKELSDELCRCKYSITRDFIVWKHYYQKMLYVLKQKLLKQDAVALCVMK